MPIRFISCLLVMRFVLIKQDNLTRKEESLYLKRIWHKVINKEDKNFISTKLKDM